MRFDSSNRSSSSVTTTGGTSPYLQEVQVDMYTIRFCRDHLSGSRGRVSVLKNAPCQVLQRTRFDSEECSLSSVLNFTPSYLQEVILHIYRRYKLLCTQSVFVVTIFPTVEDTFRFYKLLLVICYNFTPPHIQEVQVAIYTIRFLS